ncbi:ribose transport system substrate-binding protein [Sporobacter termitidis DSM 10068]|uniref:Ribose transport system substrate-binding protein n=1 Tax=Sporobacter termitidis DSM 10068 TaxID=1123282 RepID=A0A1M5YQU1_9FIRM|nr:sugar ABC transporter substrate-binding protein [Sporobacter termitidis]SHI14436.1 ribose transport system substrate-binding protein [Sporobacter termitidis DSM 10068]
MKKCRKLMALVLAVLMLVAVFASCAGTSNTTSPSASTSATPSSAAPASGETPSASTSSNGNGAEALDKLMSLEDKLPLGGIQASHLDSRASVDKALPFKAHNNPITIGWCSATQSATFFTEMVTSAKAAADKYGYKLNYQVADFDVNKQMTQIENFLTQNVDFLVINAVDIDATSSYYQQAVDKGIPVIVVGPTGGKPEYPIITTVVSASFECGYVVGEYTAEKLYDQFKNTPIKIGALVSRAGDADSNSRCCGLISGYLHKFAELSGKPYPSKWDAVLDGYDFWTECRDSGSGTFENIINFVGYGSAGSTESNAGQPFAADLLTAHPDMNLFFVETATLQPGVMAEIAQHGLTAGEDIYVACGADGEDWTLDEINKGTILCTGTNAPYYTGEGVVDLIHKIVDEGFDANNLPATSYTPTYVISVDNIKQYYDPNRLFAPMLPWDIQTIDQYNAANGG